MNIRDAKTPGTRLSLALLLLVILAITLPFLNKAFHVDDTVFVWLAEEKLDDPLALGLPDHGYEGNFFPVYVDTHPPLVASYLALLVYLSGGGSEGGLHLGFIIFPALSAVSMFFLARRFTDSPLVASLLLILTPGFMVMAQSVMTDVPSLSFWLAAIAAYVYAVDRGDKRLLAVASVFIALGVLTTYQSLSLVPLLFIYALMKGKMNPGNMAPLVVALAVFSGVILLFYAKTGGPPKLSYSTGLDLSAGFIANKMLATISVVGGAAVFPVIIAVGLLKGRKDYLAFAVFFLAMAAYFLYRVPTGDYTPAAAILQTFFYSAGILFIYRLFSLVADGALTRPWPQEFRDSLFLFLWMAGVMAYTILLLPYASTRYLLPLFPPLVLLFVRIARGTFPERGKWTKFALAAVLLTASCGLAVSVADYQLAGAYRDFAAQEAPRLQEEGRRLWFAGEFGLRYYLEESGGAYLTSDDDSPAPGDYVVLSHELIAHFISKDLEGRLQPAGSVEYPTGWPVRLQDVTSQAGFYDQYHGNLPYSLSSGPVEIIDIFVVKE